MNTKKTTQSVSVAEATDTLLRWRLKGAPTLEDVTTMLDNGIINQEEARQILFSELDKNGQRKALEEQVEFLKDIIDRLSKQPPQVVWKYVESYSPRNPWIGYTTYTSPTILGSSVGAFANSASLNSLSSAGAGAGTYRTGIVTG